MNSKSAIAADKYDSELAKIGKLQRLEPYITSRQKIMHRCLVHGAEGLQSPNQALSGYGLKCCQVAAVKAAAQRKLKTFASTYDLKLAQFGRVIRVGEFIDAQTPILHRCLKHNEEHLIRPRVAVRGSGLLCCRHEAGRLVQQEKSRNAALKYDSQLAKLGKLKRIDEYIKSDTPILHRCLIHGEEYRISPDNALKGKGLKCCRKEEGWDTIQNILEGKPLAGPIEHPTVLYVFSVPSKPTWIKIGISVDIRDRVRDVKSKGVYGDLIASWQLSDRRRAVAIETALLRDPHLKLPPNAASNFDVGAGASEIRESDDIDALCAHIDEIIEPLISEQVTWSDWGLQYIPRLSDWERIKLQELSSMVL